VEPFVTTVGQLNFFRWFIEKEILEFVLENKETIETDMNKTLKEHYSRDNTPSTSTTLSTEASTVASTASSRKRRSELTTNAMKKVNCHACPTVVAFD
jgi:hypothetical protein